MGSNPFTSTLPASEHTNGLFPERRPESWKFTAGFLSAYEEENEERRRYEPANAKVTFPASPFKF